MVPAVVAAGPHRGAAGGPAAALPQDDGRADWNVRFDAAYRAVEDGCFDKVVLARARRIDSPGGFDALATARELSARYRQCRTILWDEPSLGALVAATPETLVSVHGPNLSTHALAGTVRRSGDDRADGFALLSCEKNRREHDWVVRSIVDALEPLCGQITVADQPTPVARGPVLHLSSSISAVMREGQDVLHAVSALHPTAALGGYPRARSLAWLADNEGIERGYYAAPIGWVTREGGHFSVAIRCALLRDDSAWLYAGAGIVAASNRNDEWRETALKMSAVAQALRPKRGGS